MCKHESYVFEYAPTPPWGNIFKLDLRVDQQDPYLATLGKSLLKLIKLLRLGSVRMKWGLKHPLLSNATQSQPLIPFPIFLCQRVHCDVIVLCT